MVVTVSTVKDSLENVRFFVGANLASGVDHMVIFLDAPQPAVREWLDRHPSVTCVPAHDWWQGAKPANLNRRQAINANACKQVVSQTCPQVEWLFHIDADEVALLDRDQLAGVPAGAQAIRLPPHEAVSIGDAHDRPTQFKRLLDEGELSLLHSLGVLPEPTNSLHFRSHIAGKVGVRPHAPDLAMRHHRVVTSAGETLEHFKTPGLGLLHYESWSGTEFVRKWTAMIGSGPAINFGQHRQVIADGIRALLAKQLAPEVTASYLSRLYEAHMADDLPVLTELDLLLDVDPLHGGHNPSPLDPAQGEALSRGLASLGGVDKTQFVPRAAPVAQKPPPQPPRRAAGRLLRRRHS